MKIKIRALCFFICLIIILGYPLCFNSEDLFDSAVYSIDNFAAEAMDKTGTPGCSVAVVCKDKSLIKTYGFSNREAGELVTEDTLFEIGSVSKAFTALGILYLEKQGLVDLNDSVKKYIPWLTLNFNGFYEGREYKGDVEVTVKHVFEHESGIPFNTIGYIPEGSSEDMLERTVRNLADSELEFFPGTQYLYATINYDILGLIIQYVSGQSYEDFMIEKIFRPLKLYNTYIRRGDALATGKFAKGYKRLFMTSQPYDAPEYRGNTPAGYIVTNAVDMIRWMQIQMGIADDIPQFYEELIKRSHTYREEPLNLGDTVFSAGWSLTIGTGQLSFAGSNPNFAASIMMDMKSKTGICVLENQNSNASGHIASNFFNTLNKTGYTEITTDMYQSQDDTFTVVFLNILIFSAVILILILITVTQIIRKKRIRAEITYKTVITLLSVTAVTAILVFILIKIPSMMFFGFPWEAISVWGSSLILISFITAVCSVLLFYIYAVLLMFYEKSGKKNYFLE